VQVAHELGEAKQQATEATVLPTNGNGNGNVVITKEVLDAAAAAAAAAGAKAAADAVAAAAAAALLAVKNHNPAGVLSGIHIRLPRKVRAVSHIKIKQGTSTFAFRVAKT
jgi:hypothetical protein